MKDDGNGCRKMKADRDGDELQDDEMKTSSVHHTAALTLANLPASNKKNPNDREDGGGRAAARTRVCTVKDGTA